MEPEPQKQPIAICLVGVEKDLVQAGFLQAAQEGGYQADVLGVRAKTAHDAMQEAFDWAEAHRTGGIVFAGADAACLDYVDAVATFGCSVGLAGVTGEWLEHLPEDVRFTVTCEDRTCAKTAAELLCEAIGPVQEGYVAVNLQDLTQEEPLWTCFIEEWKAISSVQIVSAQQLPQDLQQAKAVVVSTMLSFEGICGVFGTDENMADGWREAAQALNREPVAIVSLGAGGQNLERLKNGELYAVVERPYYEMGREAARSIISQIEEGSAQNAALDCIVLATPQDADAFQQQYGK